MEACKHALDATGVPAARARGEVHGRALLSALPLPPEGLFENPLVERQILDHLLEPLILGAQVAELDVDGVRPFGGRRPAFRRTVVRSTEKTSRVPRGGAERRTSRGEKLGRLPTALLPPTDGTVNGGRALAS